MKTIVIQEHTLDLIFSQLNNQLNGSYTNRYGENIISFNNHNGNGTIRGINFSDGISFLEFQVCFKEDTTLSIENISENIISFDYCYEGHLEHQFEGKKSRCLIESFQTAILSNSNLTSNLFFKKGIDVNVHLITVNCIESFESDDSLHSKLYETFIANREDNYLYLGSYNLAIAEKINQLNAIKQEGVVRKLLLEGLVHIILALEIQQHKEDNSSLRANNGSLTNKEMLEVKELSSYIINYPEIDDSIDELARKIGLSSVKLQEGFKRMHNCTVNEFIREQRIKKSEELIKNSDMNISQIVYSIGFSSRSYFSKIFKRKYNCSPLEYKSKNKIALSA